jgi:hypothetical protein
MIAELMDCSPSNDYSPAFGDGNYRYARRPKALQQILQEIQECADKPLTQSTTLPPEAYTSQAFYQWEIENIFRNEWICLAHISQISSPGDFLNVDFLGEPLIVVHGKDHEVRVLSRVCPHRAMGHHAARIRVRWPRAGERQRRKGGLWPHSAVSLSLSCLDL